MTEQMTIQPEQIIKFQDLLPAVLKTIPRIPSLVGAIKDMKNLSMDDVNSLGLIVEKNAALYPNNRSLLYEDQVFTHRQFNERVNKYANYLYSIGIKKGDVVGVLLENRPELVMLIVAISKLGAVSSLINPNQTGKILLHSISLTCKKVFIVGEEMFMSFNDILPKLKLPADSSLYFLPDGTDMRAPDGYMDLLPLIEASSSRNPSTTGSVKTADPFAYVFTSGTTGLPKASVQLHYRWIAGGNWFGRLNMGLTKDDTMYIPLPLYHTNGLNVAWSAAFAVGAAIAIRRKFSASNFLNDARKFKATSFVYIGEVCRYLMNQPAKKDDSVNPIVKMVGNGLRPDIWKLFKKRFNIPFVYELYGAAEGSSAFTNFFNVDCSVGVSPSPYAIVKYDADEGKAVRGSDGFLQKVDKGEPGLMLSKITEKFPFAGYTSKKETEKKIYRDVFEKGDMWFNTGDLMRDIGFKHAQFVDRLGDTFRWKGENVSTTEVEEIVNQIDGISGSTVYGVGIPGTDGRAGMVSIITDSQKDDVDKKELAQVLRRDLPSYAVPLFVRIKKLFDTTHTHKIKKTDLKKEGFSPENTSDPLYALLPGKDVYQPLTNELYSEICKGKFKF